MGAITIRGVPDEVKQRLAAEASANGKSMQAFLLGILKQHAGFNRNRAMLAEIQRRVDAIPPEERKELPRAAEVLHAARREAGREQVIVVDASAAADSVLLRDDRGTRVRQRLSDDTDWLVPEHWRAEVFSVIRGHSLGRKISDDDAEDALLQLSAVEVEQVGICALIEPMWALRNNFSAYDAPYVALAAQRDLTLVTGDGPLARAAVAHCRVQLV